MQRLQDFSYKALRAATISRRTEIYASAPMKTKM